MIEDYFPSPPLKLPENLRTWSRKMRHTMTDAEALLWALIRNRRIAGAKFRRQHPIKPYILDFYCIEHKLAIELDGSQHMTTAAYDYDVQRTKVLSAMGIRVLRFWNNQVLTETESVLEIIYSTCQHPHPNPLPLAGEGACTVSDFEE